MRLMLELLKEVAKSTTGNKVEALYGRDEIGCCCCLAFMKNP